MKFSIHNWVDPISTIGIVRRHGGMQTLFRSQNRPSSLALALLNQIPDTLFTFKYLNSFKADEKKDNL